MMGICKSCFGGGGKYLGQSPVHDSYLAPDAEKLLASQDEAASIVSREPVDTVKPMMLAYKEQASADAQESPAVGPAVEVDEASEEVEETLPQEDQVQLTVSSVGSLGGVLEDVPEHCELGASEDNPSAEDGVEKVGCLVGEGAGVPVGGSAAKPTPKVRHHSFGSRTILAANPNEGKKNTCLFISISQFVVLGWTYGH